MDNKSPESSTPTLEPTITPETTTPQVKSGGFFGGILSAIGLRHDVIPTETPTETEIPTPTTIPPTVSTTTEDPK